MASGSLHELIVILPDFIYSLRSTLGPFGTRKQLLSLLQVNLAENRLVGLAVVFGYISVLLLSESTGSPEATRKEIQQLVSQLAGVSRALFPYSFFLPGDFPGVKELLANIKLPSARQTAESSSEDKADMMARAKALFVWLRQKGWPEPYGNLAEALEALKDAGVFRASKKL